MAELKSGTPFRRRFTIISRIGEGLSGDVYKARDTDGRLVALKLFDPKNNRGSMTVASYFSNEPVLLRAIKQARSHPNIVEYVAHASDQPPYFLATRFVEGPEPNRLEDLLGRPLPAGFVVRVISEIGGALDYLHFGHPSYSPIIHRDVKPHNILINAQGSAVLIDLSIASHRGHMVTRTHRLATWRYSAPEQHKGEAVIASDQFALALIAFQMLTGEALLARSQTDSQTNAWQRLNEIMQSDYALVQEHLRSRPHTARALIRALQYEPADRFPSCEAFAAALRQALVKDRVSLAKVSPPFHFRLSKKSLQLLGLIALMLLALGLALYL